MFCTIRYGVSFFLFVNTLRNVRLLARLHRSDLLSLCRFNRFLYTISEKHSFDSFPL